MAKRQKVQRFSIQGWDMRHYRETEAYAQAVQSLYDKATLAITRAAARGKIDPDTPFSFDMYPSVQKEMQRITEQLAERVTVVIETGSKKQWLFACDKNDAFLSSIMDTSKLSKSRLKKMQDRNLDALAAFQGRKVDGMNLSQRVWKYVGQYKDQLENALDVGLGDGRSADELSRDVRQNLNDPNRLFRRVRDKRGNLVLSKRAAAFHPGRGVYRSSYKNAMRLTRSEINMAYRESDWQRWQSLDFVVGFEIHRSNHELLCKCDTCAKLVGRYPKTFKFKGWHPQCMCYATPILMDEETFDENELGDLKAALKGTTYKHQQAKNAVTDVPDGFKAWVKDHVEAQKGWASTPYFIKDNFVDGQLGKGLKIAMPTTTPAGKVDFHVPFEQLTVKERYKWLSFTTEMFPIDYDWEKACQLYGVDIKPWAKKLEQALNNNEYWMESELRAEHNQLTTQLRAAIAYTKSQVEQLIADFAKAVEGAKSWLADNESGTLDYTRKYFANEQGEEYPNYKTIINAANSSLNVSKLQDATNKAKQAYNGAVSQAKTIIASVDKSTTEALRNILAEKPTETYPGELLTADILAEIKNVKASQIGASGLVKVTQTGITEYRTPKTGMTDVEKWESFRDGIFNRYGRDSGDYIVGIVKKFDSLIAGNPNFAKNCLSKCNSYNGKEERFVFEAGSHFVAIKSATAKDIAPQWVAQFNECVKRINQCDVTNKGFMSVYHDIEHAYNILMLSKSKAAKAFGLDKLSDKMPVDVIEKYCKKIARFERHLPKKEFWDSMPEYIPLSTGTSGTHYSPGNKIVSIPFDKDNMFRLDESDWYKSGLFYHEFGHATDRCLGWRRATGFKSVYDTFKREIASKPDVLTTIAKMLKEEYNKGINVTDYEERLGAVTDCLQAAIPGHLFIQPRGHSSDYFSSEEKQMAEFIAHCSENYWRGNDLFKQLFPDTYKEMREIIKKSLKL